jgi:hypothetical protein
MEQPPVSKTGFLRRFPDEDVFVALSQYVVIRSMSRVHKHEILAVNYVNGRFVRLPARERPLFNALARGAMSIPVSKKSLRRRLEKLHRLGLVAVLD